MFFNPTSEHVVIETQTPDNLSNRDVVLLNQFAVYRIQTLYYLKSAYTSQRTPAIFASKRLLLVRQETANTGSVCFLLLSLSCFYLGWLVYQCPVFVIGAMYRHSRSQPGSCSVSLPVMLRLFKVRYLNGSATGSRCFPAIRDG